MDKQFNKSEQEITKLLRKIGEGILLTSEEKTVLKVKITDQIADSVTKITQKQYKGQAYKLNIKGVTMPFVPIILAIILAGGAGTAVLADGAAPGNALYGLDQAMERFQERMTTNPGAKARLWAKMSDERAQELLALQNINPEELTSRAEELWEKHREEAVDRLAASIERVEIMQEKFQEKLAAAEDENQKAAFQRVINHLDEVKERREARMDQIEEREFPGIGNKPVRQMIRERIEEGKALMKTTREEIGEVVEEFGDYFPGKGVGPRHLGPPAASDNADEIDESESTTTAGDDASTDDQLEDENEGQEVPGDITQAQSV